MNTTSASAAELERKKYSKIWAIDQYRRVSPGERDLSHFLKEASPLEGDSITDIGCGTGRAAIQLQAAGFKVTATDICPTAPDPAMSGHYNIPFICAALWELVALRTDWIYCVDVMEHIPENFVDRSLKSMAKITKKGGYIQIALFDDTCFGNLIKDKLHLTLETSAWWENKIEKYWKINKMYHDKMWARFFVGESII